VSTVLVDSNVILDLLVEKSPWREWSINALGRVAEHARLVVNVIIYAELSVGYESIESVDSLLPPIFEREPIPYEAAFLAGKVYLQYRRRGGVKSAPLPDFFIGAHAAIKGYQLLTRDTARYRSYFPGLTLIAPE
jgi:predicted nucleic acid-binding protein